MNRNFAIADENDDSFFVFKFPFIIDPYLGKKDYNYQPYNNLYIYTEIFLKQH